MKPSRPYLGVISMFYARPFQARHFGHFREARAAGLSFMELLVPEPGELDAAATREVLAEAGLGIVLAARVNLSRDISSANPEARAAGEKYLRYCVDAARELGAKIVGGPLYGAPLVFAGRAPAPVDEDERERRVERTVASLRGAPTYATEHGVRLALEPLNRFETDMVNTTRHGIAIVEAVGSRALGLLLDTFHMNMEDPDLGDAIRAAGRRLYHFQANENHRGFVGTGHIDWLRVVQALTEIGYDGPITLEPFRRADERPGVPLAQWRPPTTDENPALAASVKYLKARFAKAVAS